MATSRAGGAFSLSCDGSTRIHGLPRSGGTWTLGYVVLPVARAGGAFSLDFSGGTRVAALALEVARAGGEAALTFASGTHLGGFPLSPSRAGGVFSLEFFEAGKVALVPPPALVSRDGGEASLEFFSAERVVFVPPRVLVSRDGGEASLGFFGATLAVSALPTIGNFSIPPGTPISRSAVLSFDLTDTTGVFRLVIVTATYVGTTIADVVHDGTAFAGAYATASFRVSIPRGFRYTIGRRGGWPAPPSLQVYAIDPSGNEIP